MGVDDSTWMDDLREDSGEGICIGKEMHCQMLEQFTRLRAASGEPEGCIERVYECLL